MPSLKGFGGGGHKAATSPDVAFRPCDAIFDDVFVDTILVSLAFQLVSERADLRSFVRVLQALCV